MIRFLLIVTVRNIFCVSHRANDDVFNMSEIRNTLEDIEASVALALVIHNDSRFKLYLQKTDITCGVFSNNSALPDELMPGESSVSFMEKVSKEFLSPKRCI